MKKMLMSAAVISLLVGISMGADTAPTATAHLKSADGRDHGTVELQQTPSGVVISASLKGLSSKGHGFHIHETGSCATGDFKSAGGHYNPKNHTHGIAHGASAHAGDLPNVFAGQTGETRVDIYTSEITLTKGPTSVLDADGSAFIIHARADTYGEKAGAGPRIASGVIVAK